MATTADLIADARIYAAQVLAGAGAQLTNAIGVLGSLSEGVEQPIPAMTVTVPAGLDLPTEPIYNGTHFTRPQLTATAPILTSLPSLVFPEAPTQTFQSIVFNEPLKPGDFPNRSSLGRIPDLGEDELNAPDAPDLQGEIQGIAKPVVRTFTVPEAPPIVNVDFDGHRPDFNVSAPTGLDGKFRDAFQSSKSTMLTMNKAALEAFLDSDFPQFRIQRDALAARLATFLQGGTALTPEVQDEILTRAGDKIDAEARQQRETAMEEFSRIGFMLPNPMMVDRLDALDQTGRDNKARATIDLAIRIAELEQENMQFAVKATSEMQQIALTAAMAYYSGLVQENGQAVTYATGLIDAIVKTYDIAARIAETQARIYEADARVFEARQRGVLAVLEVYKARLAGIEAQVNVDRAQVEVYKARIDAIKSEADIYKAQIEGLTAKAQIKRLQVEIFQARVQAYVAENNAIVAQWQGYEASVKGETARIDAMRAVEESFRSKVAVYAEQVRAKSMEIEAITRVNESATRVYATQIDAFRALVLAESEAIRAEVESFSETLKAYIARCQASTEKSRADVAAYQVGHTAMIETARLFYQNLLERAKIHEARIEAAAKIHGDGARQYASVAMSTLSGMTTLASDNINRSA